jgi:hypothetical protein
LIPGTTKKKKVVGLELGPLSLVSTTEELFDRKVAAPVYKIENTAVGIRHADHVAPLSAKVGNHFADKWRSLGRYSSLVDSRPWSLFVCFCLTLRYSFSNDYVSDVEENSHHCLHFWLAYFLLASFSVKLVSSNASIPSLFLNSPPHFHKTFQMCCLIFIPVTNLAEQDNLVTLKQSSEANQLM